MNTISDNTVFVIISNLDAVSIVRFLSTSKRLWKLRSNPVIVDKVNPYQKYIEEKYWNGGICEATERYNLPQMFYFLDKGATRIYYPFYKVVKHGHKHLIDFFISKKGGIDDEMYQKGLAGAVHGGHMQLVEYFVNICCLDNTRKNESFSRLLGSAFTDRRFDIMNLLIENGANLWKKPLFHAVGKGDEEMMEFFWNKGGERDLERLMWNAAVYGQCNAIEWLIEKGVEGEDVFSWGFEGAAAGGYKDLMDFFLEKGASQTPSKLDCALRCAAQRGRQETVKYLIELGATNLRGALSAARCGPHKHLIRYLLDLGADKMEYPEFDDLDFFLRTPQDEEIGEEESSDQDTSGSISESLKRKYPEYSQLTVSNANKCTRWNNWSSKVVPLQEEVGMLIRPSEFCETNTL